MSGRENGVYGLIIVLIIIFIITVGFIFELGKKALYINSRQNETVDLDLPNEDLQIDEDKEYIYRINGKPNLQLGKIQIRTYSSLNSPSGGPEEERESKKNEFLSKIYSKDVTSPSFIVKEFHIIHYKRFDNVILKNITYALISIIMRYI